MISSERQYLRTWTTLALALVLIAAYGLRVWDLGPPSLWHDEGWSMRPIRFPLSPPTDGFAPLGERLFPALQVKGFVYNYLNNTPPLVYIILYPFVQVAGESEFSLRYTGLMLDMLTVAIGIGLLRRWSGATAALIGGALFSTSPLLWAYAREFRPYVAVPLYALILLWLTERVLSATTRFRWRSWMLLLVAELGLLYSHNLSVPLVGWLDLVVGAVWIWGRRWRWLAIWVAGQLLLLMLYLPWLAGQFPSGTPLNTLPDVKLVQIWETWQGYFAPLPWMVGVEDRLVIGSLLMVALAVLALVGVLRRNRRLGMWLVLSQVVLVPILSTIEMIAAHIDFHPRYTIAGVPATLMLLAMGAAAVTGPTVWRRVAQGAVVIIGCAVGMAGITTLKDIPRYQHDDIRALAQYYASLPPEALVVLPYAREPALQDYYGDQFGMRADVLGIALHSDAAGAVTALNMSLAERPSPAQVELLNWFQLPADLRDMLPCMLESAGRREGERVVRGLSTTAYRIERAVEFETVAVEADYGVITLQGAAVGGQETLCLHTEWVLPRATRQDWRVSARLVTTDPPGWIVARSDDDIRRNNQTPTTDWSSGDTGAVFSRLRFPAGAPPGEYALQVVVFSADRIDGVDRLVDGVPAGRVLTLSPVVRERVQDARPVPDQAHVIAADVAEGVVLQSHDADGGTLNAGQELRITLHWELAEGCCDSLPWSEATVVLRGAGWEATQPVRAYAPSSLDWLALRVPAEASGAAELILAGPDGTAVTLATYTVEQTDRVLTLPSFAIALQTEFVDLAVLEGISAEPLRLTTDEPLALTLVWRALGASEPAYRVFTHLLGADGRVIGQHDGYPVDETRPTTGWVPGEYLVDRHLLTFDAQFRDYRGPARLEVGFYDPATNQRVLLANGADHVVLPVAIEVQ